MRKLALLVPVVGLALAVLLPAAPAQAQATRTWVSGVGDDANPCSRTAPCKTFAGAISKTAANGIINCIDPGGFGAVTITKSIMIDCLNTQAGILASGTNAININGAGIIVVLRGLSIEGVGTGLIGVNIIQAAVVHIEKSTIRGFRAGTATGVRIVTSSGNVEVNITDTYVTDNGTGATGGGIISAPSVGLALVALHNVRVFNNVQGVANNVNSRMRISFSVFAGNTIGVEADAGAQVSLTNIDIYSNATAILGATISFGNNRLSGNVADGTAPTPAGPASTDLGQK